MMTANSEEPSEPQEEKWDDASHRTDTVCANGAPTVPAPPVPAYTAMDIYEKEFFLGISSLTGPSWCGAIAWYNLASASDSTVDLSDYLADYVTMACSIGDVTILPHSAAGEDESAVVKRALVGLDDGSLVALRLVSGNANGKTNPGATPHSIPSPIEFKSCEHDAPIVRVATGRGPSAPAWSGIAVSMAADGAVKLWDLLPFMSVCRWRAHSSRLPGPLSPDISLHPGSGPTRMASCGGGEAALWDYRCPASRVGRVARLPVFSDAVEGVADVTAISWATDELLLVGSATGQIRLYDSRQLVSQPSSPSMHSGYQRRHCQPLATLQLNTKSQVTRLVPAGHNQLYAALCDDFSIHAVQCPGRPKDHSVISIPSSAEQTEVPICDPFAFSPPVYSSRTSHTDYPRAVCFHSDEGTLWSCGLDASVVRHRWRENVANPLVVTREDWVF